MEGREGGEIATLTATMSSPMAVTPLPRSQSGSESGSRPPSSLSSSDRAHQVKCNMLHCKARTAMCVQLEKEVTELSGR